MTKTQLDKINKISAQIVELREQLDQIWLDLKDEYNERAGAMSLSRLEYSEQAELIITFLENTTTCLVHAEDLIIEINQVYHDKK